MKEKKKKVPTRKQGSGYLFSKQKQTDKPRFPWYPLIFTFALYIAVHRKFQTRRVAEDGTHLYGEATQHSMRLSVDGYISRTAAKH